MKMTNWLRYDRNFSYCLFSKTPYSLAITELTLANRSGLLSFIILRWEKKYSQGPELGSCGALPEVPELRLPRASSWSILNIYLRPGGTNMQPYAYQGVPGEEGQ